MLEVLPYSSVGGKGRETWEVETEAEATVAQVEEASGTAVSKVVGTSAAIWMLQSLPVFSLYFLIPYSRPGILSFPFPMCTDDKFLK